jgi:hypothetical protein
MVRNVHASASRGARDGIQEDVTTIAPTLHVRTLTPHIRSSRVIESPSRTGATARDVQAGDAEDRRGAVDARRVAGHVLRLHHQE